MSNGEIDYLQAKSFLWIVYICLQTLWVNAVPDIRNCCLLHSSHSHCGIVGLSTWKNLKSMHIITKPLFSKAQSPTSKSVQSMHIIITQAICKLKWSNMQYGWLSLNRFKYSYKVGWRWAENKNWSFCCLLEIKVVNLCCRMLPGEKCFLRFESRAACESVDTCGVTWWTQLTISHPHKPLSGKNHHTVVHIRYKNCPKVNSVCIPHCALQSKDCRSAQYVW